MGPCPFCGEGIGAEARICKHCDRPVLYSVSLTASLDDRQKHELIRLWQKEDFQNIKHLTFGTYADAKKTLEKIPTALAWDLNQYQASSLAKKFEHLGVEPRFQGGLPSTYQPAAEEKSKSSHWASAIYGAVGLGLIFGAAVVLWERLRNDSKPQTLSRTETFTYDRPGTLNDKIPDLTPIPLMNGESRGESLHPGMAQEHKMDRESVEYILSSTVYISGESSLGSGFLVTPDGYILSNAHVTRDMKTPFVTLKDGRRYEARKIKEDSKYDISLIKIDERDLPYMKLGDANKIYAGEPVITVGNPGGLAFTVTRGIISFNGRMIGDVPYIQTDAAINRGNSGGPMISQNLEVIGINTLTSVNEQGISFALPINLACDINGVSSGIGTEPSNCPTYEAPQEKMDKVSLARAPNGSRGGGTGASDIYRREAEELKERLAKEEQEIVEKNQTLQNKANEIVSQANADPLNQSLKDRAASEIAELKAKSLALQKEQAEARLRYLSGVIGILERQSLDSAFSSIRPQIDSQMEQLRASREKLLDFLKQ